MMRNLKFGREWRGAAGAALFLACAWPGPSCPAALRKLRTCRDEGTEYVAIADLSRLYGLRLSAPASDRIVLSSQYNSMMFEPEGRRMSLMDVQLWLEQPVARIQGRWAISRTDAASLVDPIVRPYLYLKDQHCRTVVIDAGHGGKDSGTIGRGGLFEKDVALDLARRVRAKLRDEDLRVVLTRDADIFLDLDERSRIAAKWRADVFVSLHLNASPDPAASGIETYVLTKPGRPSTNASDQRPSARYTPCLGNHFDVASAVLGFQLQRRALTHSAAEDRGLRHARFAVLRDTACAAALVECGFLSNRGEEKKMRLDGYLDSVAEGVARGVRAYVDNVRQARLALP